MNKYVVSYYNTVTHTNELKQLYANSLKEAVGQWVRVSDSSYTTHGIQQVPDDRLQP